MTEPHNKDDATTRDSARERLLKAAFNIAARQGEQAVTYRSVAIQAGVAHGLVRHYFGSREALIDEVMERAAALDAAEVGLKAQSVDTFVREFVGVLDASPERQLLQFDFVLSAARGRIAKERATALYDRYISLVRETFRNLGVHDPDGAWAELVFTILDGLTLQHNLYQDPDRTERILGRLRELLEGLTASASARTPPRFAERTVAVARLRPVKESESASEATDERNRQ